MKARKEFSPRTLNQLNETWPAGLDHISASSMTMFMRCPEQWRQRYCLDRKQPPAGALLWGRADQQAATWNYEQKIISHEDLPVEDVQDFFAESLRGALDMYGGPAEVEWERGVRLTGADATKQAAKVNDAGVKLAAAHHETVAPFVQPVAVELRFEVPSFDLPVRIDGYIDVETQEKCIERKTSARAETKPKPDWLLQGRVYAAVRRKPVVWHQSVRRLKDPYAIQETPELRVEASDTHTEQTLALLAQTVRLIGHLYSTYGPDHPWPGALTHPWACGFCGFRPECPWW